MKPLALLSNAVFTGSLLGGGALPPDFANRCVKSLAVVWAGSSGAALGGSRLRFGPAGRAAGSGRRVGPVA